jgi:predicted transposase YdaD
VDQLLAPGLTVLPLVPLSDVKEEKLPEVLLAISARLAREAGPEEAATLWNATRVLMGLRYSEQKVDSIIEEASAMLLGIRGIEESSVYQGILKKGEAIGEAKGAAKEARKILLRQGSKRLGPPDEPIRGRIAAITELDRLRGLLNRILDVSSWEEFLRIEGISAVLLGSREIDKSPVFRDIFNEGEAAGKAKGAVNEARKTLLRQGGTKLGPPDEQIGGRIAEITELDRLHVLLDRILDVSSWDKLLASEDGERCALEQPSH